MLVETETRFSSGSGTSPIYEKEYETNPPKEYKWSDLYFTGISTDEIINSLGGCNDNEDDYLKFDNESQKKEEIKW